MNRRTLLSLLAVVIGAIALAVACGPSGFQSATVIDSVRILATRADDDKAYAKPGDVVTLETLTVDGRTTKTPPAVTYWIPFVCTNPIDDLYYGCFAPLFGDAGTGGVSLPPVPDAGSGAGEDAGAIDAGAGDAAGEDAAALPLSPVIPAGALAGLFQPFTNITPYLSTGPFTFAVPSDIIATHPPVAGSPAPYGLVIVFNIACAGRVTTLPIDPAGGPQQVPIGCYDDSGNPLGPDQYVIGFTRVYVYATLTDVNPRIGGFLFDGVETDAGGGAGLPAPIEVKTKACGGSCSGVNLDMDVTPASWTPGKSIWVDYFAMGGSLGSDARLLYDQAQGRQTDTVNPVTYSPPDDPGPATIWAVVHDSNDGVTWVQINVTAE